MSNLKKRKFDTFLFLPVVILLALGTVMVFSASTPTAALDPSCRGDAYFFLKRHLIWITLGLIGMNFTYRINLKKWRKHSLLLVGAAMLGLIAIFIPGLSAEVLGAKRSIIIGPISFQPSEFAKLALIFYLADSLARRQEKRSDMKSSLLPLLVFGLITILILKQPDLGTTISIGGTVIGLLFMAGTNGFHLLGIMALGGMGTAILIFKKSYRMKRILAFLDPWKYADDLGYQIVQSLVALGSGGLFGLGLGESRQKFFYLPERFTDFIFAIIGEELGLVYGTLPVIILFVIILYKGLRIASNTRDSFLSLLAGGITFQIVLQAFINMGVVTGILPCTGIPLPFISLGGASLIVSLMSYGILLNIASLPRGKYTPRESEDLVKRPRFTDTDTISIPVIKDEQKVEA